MASVTSCSTQASGQEEVYWDSGSPSRRPAHNCPNFAPWAEPLFLQSGPGGGGGYVAIHMNPARVCVHGGDGGY